MWKDFLSLIWKTLRLNERTQENTDKIKILQQQVETLSKALQWQHQEVQRISEREQHEREVLALQLKHELEKHQLQPEIDRLRAEQTLLTAKPTANTKDKTESE